MWLTKKMGAMVIEGQNWTRMEFEEQKAEKKET